MRMKDMNNSADEKNTMMNMKNNLLRVIQMYGFALNDLCLFLDTHPQDEEALICFDKYRKLLTEAEDEFNEKFGILKCRQNSNAKRWDWVCEPWPWEREE